MMHLLDTNVISELHKVGGGKIYARVQAWAQSVPIKSQFLSSATILELELGILRRERRDPAQGARLRTWLHGSVLPAFEGRILSFDLTAALQCAKLHVPDPSSDRDAIIAATALVHGMTVVTRNVAGFERTGVLLLNPWED